MVLIKNSLSYLKTCRCCRGRNPAVSLIQRLQNTQTTQDNFTLVQAVDFHMHEKNTYFNYKKIWQLIFCYCGRPSRTLQILRAKPVNEQDIKDKCGVMFDTNSSTYKKC